MQVTKKKCRNLPVKQSVMISWKYMCMDVTGYMPKGTYNISYDIMHTTMFDPGAGIFEVKKSLL